MKNFCFDFSKLKSFDSHVRKQLPWYDLVLDALEFFTACYLTEKGTVYDIGSGTGNYYQRIAPLLEGRDAHYIGIEKAPNMYERHHRLADRGKDSLYNLDVRDFQIREPYDICIVNLMLMFLPYEAQAQILSRLLTKMSPFGILILVEKDFSRGDGFLRYVLERLTMYLKLKQGVPKEEILEKELALMGIQRPVYDMQLEGRYRVTEWLRIANFTGLAVEHER